MAQYDNQTLKELQRAEVEILQGFIEICKEFNVSYFINYGTLIGAIRHKGFIPWDDDTDVGVLKEDYEKLKRIPNSIWEEKGLRLCIPEELSAHQYVFAKIYKINTKCILESNSNLILREDLGIYEDGIWLDVFIFHRFIAEKSALKIEKKAFRLSRLYRYSKTKKRIDKNSSPKRKLIDLSQNLYFCLVNLIFSYPEKRILEKYEAIFGDEQGSFITTFDTPYPAVRSLVKYSDIFPTIDVDFEGLRVSAPRNYDKVLSKLYGDYMKLPPVEKRINHQPCVLDFGDGRGNVIDNHRTL